MRLIYYTTVPPLDEMSDALIDDLVTTVMFMIKSRNNEVIKAALGFVKVVVVSVEPELLADHLENMVTGRSALFMTFLPIFHRLIQTPFLFLFLKVVSILVHSRTHSSHFKVKVRHILERLIRKFSFEAVEGFIPEEDKKLIVNIRKRRERAKRKKDSMMDEDVAEKADQSTSKNTGSAAATKNNKQKAFEDVMLNSDESDLGSDDEDNLEDYLPEDMKSGVSSSKKVSGRLRLLILFPYKTLNHLSSRSPFLQKSSKVQAPTKILEDNLGDEVLDFLNSNVVSRVTSGARSQSKKTMQATGAGVRDEFEFNSKGRLIIHDSDEEEKDNKKKKASSSSSSLMETDENQQEADGDLYMKSLTSEAAMQRMASGKMRLVNKRKRDEDDNDEPMDLDQDEDMVDPKQVAAEKRKKAEEKALNQMLGRQYKAKVRRKFCCFRLGEMIYIINVCFSQLD